MDYKTIEIEDRLHTFITLGNAIPNELRIRDVRELYKNARKELPFFLLASLSKVPTIIN
jgi:hypothetical protein